MVITKVVASPMLMAVSVFLEIPMNGHSPKNFTSTTLFTSTVLNNSNRYSRISTFSCAPKCKPRARPYARYGGAQNQALGGFVHQSGAINLCRCRVDSRTDVANTTTRLRFET